MQGLHLKALFLPLISLSLFLSVSLLSVNQRAVAQPSREPQVLQARALFVKRCSRCHGERGDGRGPFASQLKPSPPDFTSATWRANVTPKHLRRAIIGGGRAIKKSALMPAHPDLRNKPMLLKALIEHLLSLAPSASPTPSAPPAPAQP